MPPPTWAGRTSQVGLGGRRRLHLRTAGRIRYAARRARHAAVRWPAAADRTGPCVPARCAAAAPGRAGRSPGSGQCPAHPDRNRRCHVRSDRHPGQPSRGLGRRERPGHPPGAGEADVVRHGPPDRGDAPVTGQPAGTGAGRWPLLRLLWLARPLRGRLVLSVLAGAAATGCGIALLATSGFLLARASQHPSILAISIAVVAVRGLSVGRGVFRYAERLASHDAAFRILVDIRVRAFQRLERLAPAGLRTLRPGDLLARLVSDVDATQDLFLRGVAPPVAAVLAGAGAVIACLLILPPAGAALLAGLLAAGILVPWLAAARARRTGQRLAPARGEFTANFTDLLSGAADLHAFGAADAAAGRAAAAGAKLARME